MRNNKLIPLFALLLMAVQAFAQQDAQFSQYQFNSLSFNPGYAGIEKVMRVNFFSRVQWLAYQPTDKNISGGAPQSNFLSASTPIKDYKVGAGASLLYETFGPVTNFNFTLSGSKHFQIKNGLLGLGLSGGLINMRLNSDYNVVDNSDPLYLYLKANGGSQLRPDLNAGVWYEHKKYYGGVSFYHIPRADFSFGSSAISSKLANHLYITGGYRWKPTYTLDVTPSFLFQSDLNQVTYLFGALVEYNKKVWAGLNVRESLAKKDASVGGKTLSNDDIILYVGINLLKNKHNQDALRVGYAFDFVTSGVNAKKRTSHEIMLSYMIPSIWSPAPPPVRTPRYRHEN